MEPSLTDVIRNYALSLGFSAMGVSPPRILTEDKLALERWLNLGYHGDMAYMAREPSRRSRPSEVLLDVTSVIVLAVNYYPPDPLEKPVDEGMGRISRYAWGEDYHPVIEAMLKRLEEFIKSKGGPDVMCRSYVDHGPVLEKAYAREAGLGFIGKNTLLINESFGSWIFLSVILTSLSLTPSQPQLGQCGSCRLCLDACPTGALVAPYVLDARRCISYLTIESRKETPESLKAPMGNWIFGCDICQEVCPYNARPSITSFAEFRSDRGVGPGLDPGAVLELDSDDSFKKRFKGTALLRPKRKGIQRNARAVLSNRKLSPST